MPISEAHVGRTYPVTLPYQVTRAKIAEFANALGDANSAYRGENPIAPPTFAVVISSQAWGALFDDPELGLALRRTIHADQSFVYDRPLRSGDEIVASLRIDKVRSRGTMDWIGISVDLSTTAREHVCTAKSTLLHTREADA